MARAPKQSPPSTSSSPEPTTNSHPNGSQQGTPAMSTFSDILNTPLDQVEAPKVLPAGSYVCVIDGPHETGESNQKKTPFVRFNLKILSALEDVDPEEFTAAKAQGRKLQATFYLTEDSAFRLKNFLVEAVGLSGSSFKELLAAAPGNQVVAKVRHEMTNPTDGTEPRILARADNFAKV